MGFIRKHLQFTMYARTVCFMFSFFRYRSPEPSWLVANAIQTLRIPLFFLIIFFSIKTAPSFQLLTPDSILWVLFVLLLMFSPILILFEEFLEDAPLLEIEFRNLYVEWKNIEENLFHEKKQYCLEASRQYLRRHKKIVVPSFSSLKRTYEILKRFNICPQIQNIGMLAFHKISLSDIKDLQNYIEESKPLLSEYKKKVQKSREAERLRREAERVRLKEERELRENGLIATADLRQRRFQYARGACAFYIFVSPETKKVGISDNPERRLRQHQRNTKMDFEVHEIIWMKKRDHAIALESSVVKKLSERGYKKVSQEFFMVDISVVENVTNECGQELMKKGIIL